MQQHLLGRCLDSKFSQRKHLAATEHCCVKAYEPKWWCRHARPKAANCVQQSEGCKPVICSGSSRLKLAVYIKVGRHGAAVCGKHTRRLSP